MKKIKGLYIVMLILGAIMYSDSLFGAPVDAVKAKKIARNFLQSEKHIATDHLSLIITSQVLLPSAGVYTNSSANNSFYIFNINANKGFIIISGDSEVTPILGYSKSGGFSPFNMPYGLEELLEKYDQEIRYIVKNNITAGHTIHNQWENLAAGLPMNTVKDITSVEPLISTTWNQGCFYNGLCPSDTTITAPGLCGRTPTGCVATAMAQIMKYWNYPAQGTGTHSYFCNYYKNYGKLSANFGSTTYNWTAMPNNITSANNEVATLMYHCGVSISMQYGPSASGGMMIGTSICVQTALPSHFGYSASTIQGLYRSDYTDAAWLLLLKNDLNQGRPIQYVGFSPTLGGHSFVFDGYDINDYFHVNWGWGGGYNGYFTINALNPGTTAWNSSQQALIGIQPATYCGIPSGLDANSVADISATLSWGAIANAISYNIHYRETLATDWIIAASSTNSLYITGLNPSTEYEFQVQAVCANTGLFSASDTFITLPPIIPSLVVSPSYQTVTASAGSAEFTVASNIPWIVSSNATWCSVTPSGYGDGILTAAYSANNTLSNRTATITITGYGITQTVDLIQDPAPSACGLEEFYGGITAPVGWTFNGITGIYTTPGNYGLHSPSLQFNGVGDAVTTAIVNSPTILSFWLKGISTNNKSTFKVEGYNGTSWVSIATITNIPKTGTIKSYTNVSAYSEFRFTFTKSPGCIAFDDVNITCAGDNFSSKSKIDVASGIPQPILLVYPNPGTGIYSVECSGLSNGKSKINVYDLLGSLILSKETTIENNILYVNIDISNLGSGIYYLKVESTNQAVQQRILKQ